MDLKLNVSKNGLNLSAEGVNNSADAILHFGQVFRGADGKSAYQQAVEAGYKGSEEDFKELLLSYPNKADKEGYYPNMSVGIADDVKNGNTKYLAATPSGDPMHYAYEAVGAVWNASTGYWEFYDMKDITNIEMSRALARGSWYAGPNTIGVLAAFNPQSLNAIRFNVARTGAWGVTQDMDYFATTNSYIEFVNMTHDNNLVAMPFTYVTYLNESFSGCSNLRRIYGELELSNANGVRDAFKGCAKLQDIQLYALKHDISFADSPLLSKESLLYMIDNCASGVSFTITLHPDVDDKCQTEWLEDIDYALGRAEAAKNTNITLARA